MLWTKLLRDLGLVSRKEAERLLKAGGIDLDGKTLTTDQIEPYTYHLAEIKLGKHRFAQILFENGKTELICQEPLGPTVILKAIRDDQGSVQGWRYAGVE